MVSRLHHPRLALRTPSSARSVWPNPRTPRDLISTPCVSCIHAPGSPAGTSQCGDEAGHCPYWLQASQRYDGWCDKDGCDYNPYRVGKSDFYGPGETFEIDSSRPFTVVTQFITHDGTDDGYLVEVRAVADWRACVLAPPACCRTATFGGRACHLVALPDLPTMPPSQFRHTRSTRTRHTPSATCESAGASALRPGQRHHRKPPR